MIEVFVHTDESGIYDAVKLPGVPRIGDIVNAFDRSRKHWKDFTVFKIVWETCDSTVNVHMR